MDYGNFLARLSAALIGTTLVMVQPQLAVTQTLDQEAIAKKEAAQLFQQGVAQFNSGSFQEALKTYQKVLEIRSNLNDKVGIAETLDNIGEAYTGLSEYDKAMDALQQALTIRKELNNQAGVGETLNNIGYVYRLLGEYSKALELHQQTLGIAKKIDNRAVEGESLHNIAAVYAAQGEYEQALEVYKQALVIRQEVGDRRDEGRTLNNIGGVYYSIGEYNQALDYYQQALAIRRTLNDQAGIGRILSNIGLVYRQLGQYPKALEFYQQALPILEEIGDQASLGGTLNGMGVIYENLGQYDKALTVYQQSLDIAKKIGDQAGIGNTLDNIGGIYYGKGRYPQALSSYQQALEIRQKIGDKAGLGNSLNNIGGVYYNLSQYSQALEFLQQTLAIRKEIGDRAGESRVLDAIGIVYESLNQYAQALEYYQQSLSIAQAMGDRATEGEVINHIGGIYTNLGNYSQAQEFLQQALTIHREIGDKAGEGRTLNSLAEVYYISRQYPQALGILQQGLSIFKDVGDQAAVGVTFSNIGYLLEQQNQSELAIVFYKQAVNVTEAIRNDLKVLQIEQQQSFTATVAGTYRRLADLLLKQNRVLEAQQVLDLLKVQELDEYLRNVRGNNQTAQGIDLLPQEQQIAEKYDQAVQLGQELAQLRRIPESERSQNQQQRIVELEKIQQQQRAEFNQFIRSPEVMALVQELSRTSGSQNLDLPNLNRLQPNLQQLPQPTVLLYPLILEDRLELVLVTPDSPPLHRSVPVRRETLNRTLIEFRNALTTSRTSETKVKNTARQLYNWLIKPIENDLTQAKAQTILYAPDGGLRYIPLAALFDGEQWLVQRFRINNITSASLSDLTPKPLSQPRVLAGAFTQGSYDFKVGTRQFSFEGLPFAGQEVENLAAIIPNTTKLLDNAFTPQATIPRLNDHSIVHLATHAAFVTGTPEDSFIVFGNGDRITLRDVETWSLPNVDLVVLSACQTASGGQLGNGEEILGFGYQIQLTGAKASIASLWSVDDEGTQELMNAFYATLKIGNIPPAEALRQAQISFITNAVNQQHLVHPFYWAPFILIGNGL
ncbi:MAG: tetratricopeptide repeat protein [Cyanobacteriota bacterium]